MYICMTVDMRMDNELLQECMAILQKHGRIIADDLKKRFINTGLVDDAVKAFSLEYRSQISKDFCAPSEPGVHFSLIRTK